MTCVKPIYLRFSISLASFVLLLPLSPLACAPIEADDEERSFPSWTQSLGKTETQNASEKDFEDNERTPSSDNPGEGSLPQNNVDEPPSQPGQAADAERAGATPWLHTEGNQILLPDGSPFQGRGANLHDTRGCNACTTQAPDPDEVIRRADVLIDEWGANWIRLVLESYGEPSILSDPAYLDDIKRIVDHVGRKPGVYVLLSLWHDPTFTELGWPSQQTQTVWEQLTLTFADAPHVIFGLVNEPQQNYDGSRDAEVWRAMNDSVATIRRVESSLGVPQHLIAVQGTGGWARRLDYYVDHPIEAGGGENVLYEVHIYDPASSFFSMLTTPAQRLPVIIGEFGPTGNMTLADCEQLMELAETLGVPYLAWTFHMRCPPNLIEDESAGGCGVDMALRPTPWGDLVRNRMSRPWEN